MAEAHNAKFAVAFAIGSIWERFSCALSGVNLRLRPGIRDSSSWNSTAVALPHTASILHQASGSATYHALLDRLSPGDHVTERGQDFGLLTWVPQMNPQIGIRYPTTICFY